MLGKCMKNLKVRCRYTWKIRIRVVSVNIFNEDKSQINFHSCEYSTEPE